MQENVEVDERPEPRIEVAPEEPKTDTEGSKSNGPFPGKKWFWIGGGLSVVLLGIAAYWALWQREPGMKGPPPEAAQFQALEGKVQKLEQDWTQFRKELEALREEQRGLSEQVKAQKNQWAAVLAKAEKPPEKKEAPKAIAYKVKKGDTLQAVAKRFQVRPEDIRKWNRLGPKGDLSPGKTVTLYPPS
jgi:LysM repeat protein